MTGKWNPGKWLPGKWVPDSATAEKLTTVGRQLGSAALREAPRLLRTLQRTPQARPGTPGRITPGRPVASTAVPSAHRARRIEYAPDLDGRADPGEVVWTWVTFEENPHEGKDRPVLVVGRDGGTLLGLMLSSQDKRADDPNWMPIGSGPWDGEHRPSWIRLDRVLDVPEDGIRREGAVLDRARFDKIAARLRTDYSWS